uniref:CCHC-type domain-containing protein n=1 Tax=Chenopodium quinoa TaxID=63459 RepID=A0A803MFS5_CHEQI
MPAPKRFNKQYLEAHIALVSSFCFSGLISCGIESPSWLCSVVEYNKGDGCTAIVLYNDGTLASCLADLRHKKGPISRIYDDDVRRTEDVVNFKGKICELDRIGERFEKQEKEKKISYFKERKSFFNGEGSNINSNNSNNEGKMIVVTPEQAALAKKVCFKCQGMGHIARDCGNKVTVSKKEHRMLLAYLDQEEKEKESTCLLNTEEEFDFEEFEGQEKITPEPEHHHIGAASLTMANSINLISKSLKFRSQMKWV